MDWPCALRSEYFNHVSSNRVAKYSTGCLVCYMRYLRCGVIEEIKVIRNIHEMQEIQLHGYDLHLQSADFWHGRVH